MRHACFTDADRPCEKLRKALRADVDDSTVRQVRAKRRSKAKNGKA